MHITRTNTRSQRTDAIAIAAAAAAAHNNHRDRTPSTAATTKDKERTNEELDEEDEKKNTGRSTNYHRISSSTLTRASHDPSNPMTTRTAATRTPHRVTVRKTAQQVHRLQEMWAVTTTPTKEQREQIADEIGLDVRIVSTWFRDERSKLTRQRAEQQRAEQRASANHHHQQHHATATTTTSTTTASTTTGATTTAPMRSTRVSAAAASRRNQSVDAQSDFDEEDEDEEDEEALDRYQPPHQQQQQRPSAQAGTRGPASYVPPAAAVAAALPRSIERASPELKAVSSTKASMLHSPRFSPYPIPSSTSPQSRARRVHHQSRSSIDQYAAALYSRNQSPPSTATQQVASYHRSSAPIDIYHRHRTPVMQSTTMTPGGYRRHHHHHHRSRLSVETDSDYGMPSPGYPRQSVPAPSEASSSTSEDELEEEDEDEEMMMEPGEHEVYGAQHEHEHEHEHRRRHRNHDDRQGDPYRHHLHHHHSHSHSHSARDYSPRTPSQMPHSLPSPRVMHAPSSSVPTSGGLGLPPISTLGVGVGAFSPKGKPLSLSPLRNSIVLPLPEQPITLPAVALPPTSTLSPPARDSLWRWNYHDRVSSIRHTLSDKLYHNNDNVSDDRHNNNHHSNDNGSFRRRGDESEEEEALSDGGFSPISSPFFRPLRMEGATMNAANSNGGFLERIGGFFTSGGVGGGGSTAGKKQLFAAGNGGEEEMMVTTAAGTHSTI